jgi:hypothetical protein
MRVQDCLRRARSASARCNLDWHDLQRFSNPRGTLQVVFPDF